MKAARINNFGGPDVVLVEDVPRPVPGAGQVLVRVVAAGVGPWDALIREGKSKVSPQPPLTLGSDLSGVVEEVGPDVTGFSQGDQVFGVTNPGFCGAQAEFAVALAGMIAQKPQRLSHIEAASVPVVAVTAWQMLFEYGKAESGQTVLILGAAGNVGAYAVQLAATAGLHVIAAVRSKDMDYVRTLGAEKGVDLNAEQYENSSGSIDLLLDTVGGEAQSRVCPETGRNACLSRICLLGLRPIQRSFCLFLCGRNDATAARHLQFDRSLAAESSSRNRDAAEGYQARTRNVGWCAA